MELYEKFNINKTVFENIVKKLKRYPNEFEMYLFSAMHSEHCGYMHSKKYLNNFYTNNCFERENAGCIKIKDHSIFFKMESHNHPCAIEPYQGAMTGVGGIIRDVLSLGAKPVALLNSIKFGKIENEKTKYYLTEVVRGISNYGNSTGIATIAGETIFDERFNNIPIVNVFALGLVKTDKIKLSRAKENCLIVLLGSKTGIDGLNGANFASKILDDDKSSRNSVQIGDPYTKKRLIDAVLKINSLKTTVACQDLGASGILSSTSEMAYKGKCGAELYLENVHTQTNSITPFEIMLSESQERMAFVIEKEGLESFKKIAQDYELEYSIIGKTTKGNNYRVFYNGKELCNLDLDVLCNPYLFDLKKSDFKKIEKRNETIKKTSLKEQFINILKDENFTSKKYIFSQFDSEVQGRTSFSSKENSIGIQYLKEVDSYMALLAKTSIEANSYDAIRNSFLYLFRKLVAAGFEPKGLTNCLNLSNPERLEVQNDFLLAIDALRGLSHGFKIPVVSGNVSFYNEFNSSLIPPVLTLAMVGALENKDNIILPKIDINDEIFVVGKLAQYFDLKYEIKLKNLILELARKKLVKTAKIAGRFGFIGTLAKNAFFYNFGFKIFKNKLPVDFYFEKYPACYILITDKKDELQKALGKALQDEDISFLHVGKFESDKIEFEDNSFEIEKLRKNYLNKIKDEMER